MNLNTMLGEITKPTLRFLLSAEIQREKLIQSQFGGKPYIEDETDVECCGACGEKFSYVMQVLIPEKKTMRERLYSLYYCFDCASKGDTTNFQMIVYHSPKEEKSIDYVLEDEEFLFDERVIIFYNAYELPEYEFFEALYPSLKEQMNETYGKQTFQVYEDIKYRFNHYNENTGFKLFGYPEDVMPEEVPTCSVTGEKMELFLVIPSDEELGLNWGVSDESTLVIFKSPSANRFKGFVTEWDIDGEELDYI